MDVVCKIYVCLMEVLPLLLEFFLDGRCHLKLLAKSYRAETKSLHRDLTALRLSKLRLKCEKIIKVA
jgi:hypothetical protein